MEARLEESCETIVRVLAWNLPVHELGQGEDMIQKEVKAVKKGNFVFFSLFLRCPSSFL